MPYRILLPRDYSGSTRAYPVLYLLHGLTGDHQNWTTKTRLAEYAADLPLVIVMPAGENQWYSNAADGSGRFEDYILDDLQADVSRKYRIVKSRAGRAIAGLSMGGYGALKLALKRPADFAVAGSFSGAFDATRGTLDPLIGAVEGARLKGIFGPAGSRARQENDVFTLVASLRTTSAPFLYVDCGTTDPFIHTNRELAAALKKAGAAHEYHEATGGHSWDYWDRRVSEFLRVLMTKLSS